MPKYSDEYKLKVVKAYIAREGSFETIAKKYKIARTCVRQWVAQYNKTNGFIKPTGHFSGEFKLKVLNYQQEHHLSDQAVSLMFGITNVGTICAWRKKYITGGTEALFQKQGRPSKMPKKSLIPNKPREEWTEQEELAYLRMENDYLKKLVALIQEDEQRERDSKKKKSEPSKN